MLLSVHIQRGVQVADRRGLRVIPRRFHGPSRFPALPEPLYQGDEVILRRKYGVLVVAYVNQSGEMRIHAHQGLKCLNWWSVTAQVKPAAVILELPQETLVFRIDFEFVSGEMSH